MAAKITAQELKRRGQFRMEMFGIEVAGEFDVLLAQAIADASAFIASRVGSDAYDSGTEPREAALKTAELDEGHIAMLRTMLTVITGYDAAEMPPELLSPGDVQELIADLEQHRDMILEPYCVSEVEGGAYVSTGTVVVDTDDD